MNNPSPSSILCRPSALRKWGQSLLLRAQPTDSRTLEPIECPSICGGGGQFRIRQIIPGAGGADSNLEAASWSRTAICGNRHFQARRFAPAKPRRAVVSVTGTTGTAEAIQGMLAGMRRQGSQALIQQAQSNLDRNESNLLLVVDQFESCTASSRSGRPRAGGGRRLRFHALEPGGSKSAPIYVVLTMRSDFWANATPSRVCRRP